MEWVIEELVAGSRRRMRYWLCLQAEGRARRGDFSMVWRGWRDFLNLNNASAEAKAKRSLYLGSAATSGTIENVGASAPAPKRWGQNRWGLTLAVV